jgi:hypothetical protein
MIAKLFTPIAFCTLILALSVQAEKLNLESQTTLIKKIESTLVKLKPSDKSIDQLGLKAQLANLYSEQARLLIIEEGKVNCDGCQGSHKAREKSIQLYKEVLPGIQGDFKAGVALQLAHLYELLDQHQSAIGLYDDIIKNSRHDISKSFIGKAFVNRGNAFFRKGQFIPAQKDFRDALTLIRPEEKGGVLHKIAWTYFNQGEIAIAITQMKSLLSQDKYLQQVSSQGYQYSESLHTELAHDLALFMAKSDITIENVKQLVKLTPKTSNTDNLLFLGDELDRLDNVGGAIIVWKYALILPEFPNEKKPIVRVKTAKYYRERKQFDIAFKEFHQSLEDQNLCKADVCSEYPPLAKNYLTSWDKLIKARSNKVNGESARSLLQSYQDYNNHYPTEIQTLMWQAQLARDISQKQLAMESYHQAADLAASQNQNKLIEESLLAEMDLAEKINSVQGKILAYNHYITLLPKGSQIWLVKFSLANAYYDQRKYQDAADIYTIIAHKCDCKNKKDSIDLKSAHLELDSLAKIDLPERIETVAKEYALLFPKDKLVFYKIARTAGLKLAFRLASSREASDITNASRKINGIPMLGANKEEQSAYYKLKLQLDELTLDFESAYKTSLILAMDKSRNPADLIKVLTLAELSNHSDDMLIEKVIRMKSPIGDKKIAYVLKIRKAANPWPIIEKYSSVFRMDSELYSDLLIEAFTKTKNFAVVERFIRDASVVKTSDGQTLWRMVFLKKVGAAAQNLQAFRLNSSSDRMLANTFKKRLALLKDLQKKVKNADQMRDWTAQVISRSIYRTENLNLANEIQKLPVPKSLKNSEKDQYREGLVRQAKPFVSEAVLVSQQMDELWQDEASVAALLEDLKTQLEYRMVFVSEAKAVSAYAPDNIRSQLLKAINDVPVAPSIDQIKKARAEVSADPYNDSAIAELIKIEKTAGHKMMVAYLEGRRHFASQVGMVKK